MQKEKEIGNELYTIDATFDDGYRLIMKDKDIEIAWLIWNTCGEYTTDFNIIEQGSNDPRLG